MSASDREFELQILEVQTRSTNLVAVFSILTAVAFSIFGVILAITAPFTSGGPSIIVGNLTMGNTTWSGSFTQTSTAYVGPFSYLVQAEYAFLALAFIGLGELILVLLDTPRRINRIRKRFVSWEMEQPTGKIRLVSTGHGSILVGIGIVLFAIGLVVGYLAGAGLVHNLTILNMISHIASYLIQAAIAIALMVVGGVLIAIGIKKS
jgi:hypothetical protein